jgi:hypothetical protein
VLFCVRGHEATKPPTLIVLGTCVCFLCYTDVIRCANDDVMLVLGNFEVAQKLSKNQLTCMDRYRIYFPYYGERRGSGAAAAVSTEHTRVGTGYLLKIKKGVRGGRDRFGF